MPLDNIVLLAAPGARSQAYIQALTHYQHPPSHVIMMGKEETTIEKDSRNLNEWHGIYLPNLSIPISRTCVEFDIPLTHANTNSVNSAIIVDSIRKLDPDLVIYSGFGGQIVSREILDIGPSFLHLHSGSLPSYRGSTTIYYALLNQDKPSVTAILLDPEIDTGPIISEKTYPIPPYGMDIDRLYDPAIRADLLCDIMRGIRNNKTLTITREQNKENGQTYYVIHPVLKHAAILSLRKNKSELSTEALNDTEQDSTC